MGKEFNLYRICNRLGTFYVVARSFDEAANQLTKRLDDSNYGYSNYRKITNIEIIASEHFFSGKQCFNEDFGNLILSDNDGAPVQAV